LTLQNREFFLMKLSARNILPGTVESLHKGAVTTTLKVALPGGQHITSSITNEGRKAQLRETAR
jgi:molybdopterin-binding protein